MYQATNIDIIYRPYEHGGEDEKETLLNKQIDHFSYAAGKTTISESDLI
jgi:hypothetical protein